MQKIYRHRPLKLLSPRYLLTWPIFGIVWIIGQLPHKFIIRLGNLIGAALLPWFPKRTYIIRTNLQACFPKLSDHEIKRLTKQNFQSLIIGAFETGIAWYGSKRSMNKLASKFCIENEELLNEYLQKPQPLLLIGPHCMSQELVSKFLVSKYQYIPVFRHMNNPVANFLMQKARLKIYHQAILKSDTREIIKSIKNQKAPVGILPDQDFGRRRSVFVPFFDIPTATTTALSKYKKLTNCNFLALSYKRHFNSITNKFEKFVIKIHPPLNITGDNLENDARELNIILENIIKDDITAYFWLSKKFKTRPLGDAAFYNYQPNSLFEFIKSKISFKSASRV